MKQHYEHSEEEWVSKQRDQRPQEFAPPSLYSNFNPKRPISYEISEPEDKRLFFTSKKSKNNTSLPSTATSNDSTNSSGPSRSDPSCLEDSVLAGLRFLREQSEK